VVLRAAGDAAGARTQHEQALVMTREINDRYEQARAHHGIAATLDGTGAQPHRDLARRLFADLAVPVPPDLAPPAR
jgi:hypothetical protein